MFLLDVPGTDSSGCLQEEFCGPGRRCVVHPESLRNAHPCFAKNGNCISSRGLSEAWRSCRSLPKASGQLAVLGNGPHLRIQFNHPQFLASVVAPGTDSLHMPRAGCICVFVSQYPSAGQGCLWMSIGARERWFQLPVGSFSWFQLPDSQGEPIDASQDWRGCPFLGARFP